MKTAFKVIAACAFGIMAMEAYGQHEALLVILSIMCILLTFLIIPESGK